MLKAGLKKPFTYIWILLMALSLYLVKGSLLPLSGPTEVLICNESGEYGERVLEILQASGKDLTACIYTEILGEETLRSMVGRGQARCGFIFPENMEELIADGETRGMITLVTSPFSVKSALAREKVFAALYRVMNAGIIEDAEDEIFESPGLVRDYIRERYEYYAGGNDVFGLEYEVIDTAVTAAELRRDRSDPVRGTAGVLVFILCLYAASAFYGPKRSFFKALKKGESFICRYLYVLSFVLIPAVFGFVMIRILDGAGTSFFRDAFGYLLFTLFSVLWSLVFVRLFKRSEVYLPAVSVMLFVCFAICPVYYDPAEYIPVLGIVTRILPPAFYLYLL